MKTKIFKKVTIFLAMAVCIAGCSNSFDTNNEDIAKFNADDDLFVQITEQGFDLMPNEYKGSDQVTIAEGITLKRNAESENNDFILIFEPGATRGTLRIAIKKGNEYYICVFVTSELPVGGSMFLFSGDNISTLKYDFEPYIEKEDCIDDEKPYVDQGVNIEGGPGVYIVGLWIESVGGMTKSSSNIASMNWRDQAFTAQKSGNSLHLLSQSENNRIKSSTVNGFFAKLWKDGEMHTLSNYHSLANSVFVTDDGDVYVAGSAPVGRGAAAVWKNGKVQNLTPCAFMHSEANSVYVYNGDVYAVGSEESAITHNRIAKLWINGKTYNLSDEKTLMVASSVYVHNGDVYVAGFELPLEPVSCGTCVQIRSGFAIAVLWKNGQLQYLTDGVHNAWATSVFVSDNDVYVAGFERMDARLWKNGVAQDLEKGTWNWVDPLPENAYSVFVSGKDVYVAGSKVWKNGKVLYERGGNYHFESIFVSDNDVYVVGRETNFGGGYDAAQLWKNGVIQDISYGSTMSFANSVFVVK